MKVKRKKYNSIKHLRKCIRSAIAYKRYFEMDNDNRDYSMRLHNRILKFEDRNYYVG